MNSIIPSITIESYNVILKLIVLYFQMPSNSLLVSQFDNTNGEFSGYIFMRPLKKDKDIFVIEELKSRVDIFSTIKKNYASTDFSFHLSEAMKVLDFKASPDQEC